MKNLLVEMKSATMRPDPAGKQKER